MIKRSVALTDKFIIFLQFTLVFFHFFSRKAVVTESFLVFVIVTVHFSRINLFTVDGFPSFVDVPKHKWYHQ